MKHIKYLSDRSLNIRLVDGDSLKIDGLSSLKGELKNQVIQYAKDYKREIIFELQEHLNEALSGETVDGQMQKQYCPARCKSSGKCYGIAYFNGKPGKAHECIEIQCPWIEKVKRACTSA